MENAYIPKPLLTGELEHVENLGSYPTYKCAGFPKILKWSGKMALPEIGSRIYVRINSIGWGTVEGYYESHGFLGLMVRPEAPPDWYKRQVANNIKESIRAEKIGPEKAKEERIRVWPSWLLDGIAVVFGAEISLEAK